MIPRVEYGDCALIIEYKVCKQAEQLATLAERGLVQIVDKAYSTQLKSHSHIKKVLQVGLAFCGKQVASKYEQVDL
ncbi:MAG: PD-(D/E)XK nuclease domain-containing protein [Bacteroidota bacterium]